MRHYTGKHGILEGFLRDFISSGQPLPENPKHARRKAAKERARAEKQAQRQRQRQMRGQQHRPNRLQGEEEEEEEGEAQEEAAFQSAAPERIGARRKRPSHNSTGSASSPESYLEEEAGEQPQQPYLGLVVKRAKPNGEESYAIIPLKSLVGNAATTTTTSSSSSSSSSHCASAPSSNGLSAASNPSREVAAEVKQQLTCNTNVTSQLRAMTSPTGEVILRQTNQEELIKQQLAQQQQHQALPDQSTHNNGQQHTQPAGEMQPVQIELPRQPLPPEQVQPQHQQQHAHPLQVKGESITFGTKLRVHNLCLNTVF